MCTFVQGPWVFMIAWESEVEVEPSVEWIPSPLPTAEPTVEYNSSASQTLPGGVSLAMSLNGGTPSAIPSAKPVAKPTFKPSASPTAAPTVFITPTQNATLVNGYLTINGVTQYIGVNSSAINSVIWNQNYFKPISPTQMSANTKYQVWLNGQQSLNYLIITGNYIADVPIVLPSQFILVMNNASLNAVPNFPVNTVPLKIGDTIIAANDMDPGFVNSDQVMETNWALIVLSNSYYSGVVSPAGPSNAYISCKNMPSRGKDSGYTGPAGIFMGVAGSSYIDGITIDNCGLNNGNVVLSGVGRSEVTNMRLMNSRSRGVWVITMSYSIIHDCEIFNSTKFGVDLDAYAGPMLIVFRNDIHDNAYQGVFIEQGSVEAIVTDNVVSRNAQAISFYNNLFPKTTTGNVVLGNIATESRSSGINIGSVNSAAVGFYPTSNTYVIGNTITNNGLNYPDPKKRAGLTSNGPVFGVVLMANNDTTGIHTSFWNAAKIGCMMVVDPLKRVLYNDATNRPPPYMNNITIVDGVVTSRGSVVPVGTIVGTTMSAIQAFITTNFGSLGGNPKLVPWIWNPSAPKVAI